MKKAIVWTKTQCPHCISAKSLLSMKGIEYEERKIGEEWTREQLFEAVPLARTVPQIFIDDVYVGGFTDLQKYLA